MKTLEIHDFYIKIINLINFVKKNSPSGGPPIGNHLKRWACLRRPTVSGLNGAENFRKTCKTMQNLIKSKNLRKSRFSHFLAHLIDTWPLYKYNRTIGCRPSLCAISYFCAISCRFVLFIYLSIFFYFSIYFYLYHRYHWSASSL